LSISLENVRCFSGKQTLDLSDSNGKPAQWTILLGNNGTGKTTVLQVIALQAEIAAELTAMHRRHHKASNGPSFFPPRWDWFLNSDFL